MLSPAGRGAYLAVPALREEDADAEVEKEAVSARECTGKDGAGRGGAISSLRRSLNGVGGVFASVSRNGMGKAVAQHTSEEGPSRFLVASSSRPPRPRLLASLRASLATEAELSALRTYARAAFAIFGAVVFWVGGVRA
eukprot:5276597-Pleurochrysis_carterae.AAC.1